jgi:hypothetical protein
MEAAPIAGPSTGLDTSILNPYELQGETLVSKTILATASVKLNNFAPLVRE